jgi:hypothetical protein
MPIKHLIRLTIATGIFGMTFAAGQPATAQTTRAYSWCTVAEEVHCYYTTRQQCEETVDYHGFCEQNPDVPAQNSAGTRRTYPQ